MDLNWSKGKGNKGVTALQCTPSEIELILMSSDGVDGLIRSDMQDRHTEVNEVRPPFELLATLCLSSASHHRRFQWASQCAKWLVSSIKDEFAK